MIAVLTGCSSEHEISLKTAALVSAALQENGYAVTELEIGPMVAGELLTLRPDAVFIASHGRFGEDGTIQGLLEILGIPYVGSATLASALALHKGLSKSLFRQNGLPTPPAWQFSFGERWTSKLQPLYDHLLTRGALIVKPTQQGSTIGLSIVREGEELSPSIKKAFVYDDSILIEQKIEGTELAVGVLGDVEPYALPCIEIVSKNEIYDYEAKYTPGMSEHIIPPRIDPQISEKAMCMALQAHLALGCRDISRSDIIADHDGCCWLLEVNTLPGMTETSLVPDAAKAAGISYSQLIDKLITMALARRKR
ncbi:MAG: D-alanine--D-alanine ligase [Symbiobacteriaceae bacterium]|nr:D-alanine--D-alanine ligase [Symbiobacteriaceae bacterium]